MAKTNHSKLVSPACNGNGYRKIMKDATSKKTIEIDCEACDNQGEIKNDKKEALGFMIKKGVEINLSPKVKK